MGGLPYQKILAPYKRPALGVSLWQVANTVPPFIGLLVLMYFLYDYSYWACLGLAVPSSLFLLRVFCIQHDCGHGSFFTRKGLNDWTGRVLGLFSFTPYTFWKEQHATHHASAGDLDRRGAGDVPTLTVEEYAKLGWFKRLMYRLSREPWSLLTIGAPTLFIVLQRAPLYLPWSQRKLWMSVLLYNVVLTGIWTTLIWTLGLKVVWVYLPVIIFASIMGAWMFFIQHQFEGTYWERSKDWDFNKAALQGCSFYQLPRVLDWFTADISYHHIHHLSSSIPNYRLRQAFNENEVFRRDVKKLTFLESLKAARLMFWDEVDKRMVTMREAKGKLRAMQKQFNRARKNL